MRPPRRIQRSILIATLLLLTPVFSLAQEGRPVSCQCYCGISLAPPCSDSACINACGGRPERPGRRPPGRDPDPEPAPDPRLVEAVRQDELGLKAWNSGNSRLAAYHFQIAVENDPNNQLYREHLSKAKAKIETEERIAREAAARKELEDRTDEQKRKFEETRKSAPLQNVDEGPSTRFQSIEPGGSKLIPLDEAPVSPRRRQLEDQIERDVEAIRRLGFGRRAEDFEEWELLAEKARKEYEAEVKAILTEMLVDKSQESLLKGFKHFSAEKGDRLIAFFEAQENPPPPELIEAIRRLSQMRSKGRAAYDAKYIVKAIEKTQKTMKVKDRTTALPVLLGLVCDVVPQQPLNKQCKAFRYIARFTAAALYNNATRRVAEAEVERLTTLTERDLHNLNRLRRLLEKHVRELNKLKQTEGDEQ